MDRLSAVVLYSHSVLHFIVTFLPSIEVEGLGNAEEFTFWRGPMYAGQIPQNRAFSWLLHRDECQVNFPCIILPGQVSLSLEQLCHSYLTWGLLTSVPVLKYSVPTWYLLVLWTLQLKEVSLHGKKHSRMGNSNPIPDLFPHQISCVGA